MYNFWVIFWDCVTGKKRGISVRAQSVNAAWREVESMGHSVIYVC